MELADMGIEGFGPLPGLQEEGVYTASVDLQQQKVVVTGNVDSETLIKKLHKAGRHAEPWPVKPKKEKENGNKDNSSSNNSKDNGGGKGTNVSAKARDKDPGPREGRETKPAEESFTASAAKAAPNNADELSKAALNDKSPCPKGCGRDCTKSSEGKDSGSSPPPLEKPAAGGGNAEGAKVNGGKQGKKGQKEGGIGSGGELASESAGDTGNVYSHFPSYPQLPLVYAVSYSTAYPSASSGAVYYATAPAVLQQQSVVYAARAQQHCPAYYHYLPAAGVFIPPSDEKESYDVFSDENAHACRVM
ncbi:hypothetical protein Taro_052153 [Colocasia esculenta]|uniref:HMA domain-containing protein n=1 Tax=Colocasia esculenta TaxID=4460 RepID=A0A843XIT4_COLES|nr:hypothetical protein [Colocasia esculenta]